MIPFDGYESHVLYRLYPTNSGWLDYGEAARLAELLTAYWEGPAMPLRIGRALRRVEVVATERYLEDALPLVVGGFEALTKIGRKFAGRAVRAAVRCAGGRGAGRHQRERVPGGLRRPVRVGAWWRSRPHGPADVR